MEVYETKALSELRLWQLKMSKKPSFLNGFTKGIQSKINDLIPEKFHQIVTVAIKNMVQATLLGSEYTTKKYPAILSLEEKEKLVSEKLSFYKKAAAAEGAGTGAGGIFLGLVDFPLLLTLKMKFLFEVASIYEYNIKDYRERLYILYLFQLAFSSDQRRREIYAKIANWDQTIKELSPNYDAASINWRKFQQEYRDYIDLVKLLQLVPVVGAAVGAYANYRLLDTLGETAVNGYRLRYFQENEL